MSRTFDPLFPKLAQLLTALGLRLKMARLRRHISTILMAQRMGVSRDTLNRMEQGDATIAIGTYFRALRVLGLDGDIDLIARDDIVGRALQDQSLVGQVKDSLRRSKTTLTQPDSKSKDDHV